MVTNHRIRKNVLGIKLRRDMTKAVMQFLSIILLCALGTFAFSALDGTARMTRVTVDHYFSENNLADLWITLPRVDRATLAKIGSIPGVTDIRARTSLDMDTGFGDNVTLNVVAYDGPMDINIPLLRDGQLLGETDKHGCLVEEWFATAHHLEIGDSVTVKYGGARITFLIRGIVVSPEFIAISRGASADPETYGYILINSRAIPSLPLTQVILKADSDTNLDEIEAAINHILPEALIVNRGAHSSTARINNNANMFENMTLVFRCLPTSSLP